MVSIIERKRNYYYFQGSQSLGSGSGLVGHEHVWLSRITCDPNCASLALAIPFPSLFLRSAPHWFTIFPHSLSNRSSSRDWDPGPRTSVLISHSSWLVSQEWSALGESYSNEMRNNIHFINPRNYIEIRAVTTFPPYKNFVLEICTTIPSNRTTGGADAAWSLHFPK